MAADKYGSKELVAVSDGYRESKISWRELLLDLKARGLTIGLKAFNRRWEPWLLGSFR